MVVIVGDRWDAPLGGREQYATDLRHYLDGHGIAVATARPSDVLPPAAAVLALTPDPRATHYQLHGGLLSEAFAAERESLESHTRRALFSPALVLNRRRQRLLDDEARLLDRAVALMTFCERDAELLRARGVAASRVVVSRPGVNLSRFTAPASAGLEPGPLRLVFAAHNFVLKGLAAAIRAVAAARRHGVDATLTVIGRGPAARFARLAAREQVGDHVRFTGSLSQPEIASAFQRAQALLHPTFYDPFPRVAIEAMASGCAVITTRRCGASEIMVDGRQGLVVGDPRDIEALTQAIVALADRSRLAAMQSAAAATARAFDERVHFAAAARWLSAERPRP
jgi:glycosyltransferase involved in cell wall biosynthesis